MLLHDLRQNPEPKIANKCCTNAWWCPAVVNHWAEDVCQDYQNQHKPKSLNLGHFL